MLERDLMHLTLLLLISFTLLITVTVGLEKVDLDKLASHIQLDRQMYCDSKKFCENHVVCPDYWENQVKCPPETVVVDLKPHIPFILDYHNTKRNELARGDTKFPAACRMPLVKWDNELAQIAQAHAMWCGGGHDKCRIPTFTRFVGQNLYWFDGPESVSDQDTLERGMGKWWNEINNTILSDILEFGPT